MEAKICSDAKVVGVESSNIDYSSKVAELKKLEALEDYDTIITELRNLVVVDRSILENAWVKGWVGKRYRNIFIREALTDSQAIRGAYLKTFSLYTAGVIGAIVAVLLAYQHYLNQWFIVLFGVVVLLRNLDLVFELLSLVKIDNRCSAQIIAETYLRLTGPDEWVYVTGSKTVKPMPVPTWPEEVDMGVLFAPGLINGWLPVRELVTALPAVERRFPGCRVLRADTHPMRSCENNVQDIQNAVYKGIGRHPSTCDVTGEGYHFPEKFIAIGFSKGSPDLFTAFVNDPEISKRCKAMYTWAGACGGSHLADEAWEGGLKNFNQEICHQVDRVLTMFDPYVNLRRGIFHRIREINVSEGVGCLTDTYRQAYFKKHKNTFLAFDFPIFNITGSTEHEHLPWFQVDGCKKLNKWDGNNDMQ
eukprot:Ihof_evm4s406 gene=Ihof_evmTU4s406